MTFGRKGNPKIDFWANRSPKNRFWGEKVTQKSIFGGKGHPKHEKRGCKLPPSLQFALVPPPSLGVYMWLSEKYNPKVSTNSGGQRRPTAAGGPSEKFLPKQNSALFPKSRRCRMPRPAAPPTLRSGILGLRPAPKSRRRPNFQRISGFSANRVALWPRTFLLPEAAQPGNRVSG